jgi:phage terminase small subunit
MSDFKEIVDTANSKEELKLLNRDERKEYELLRKILNDLTPFQVAFIEQYIRTASARQAARLAGSQSANPEIVGYKLLQNPKIQMAISIAMKKRIEAVGLDTTEVIMKLREVYSNALADKKYEAANKALELLQKEIDRASRVGGLANASKVGEKALTRGKEDPKPVHEEDGFDTKGELENVINLLKRAESR